MTLLFKPSVAVFSIFLGLAALDFVIPEKETVSSEAKVLAAKPASQKIQAAILLDVSSSMQGLIEQAKAQLWNMVSVMGKAKCETGMAPYIEIALYEYGRSSNDPNKGYIKLLSPFTTDLDQLSQELFKLRTNGGSEYCGQVIFTSLDSLTWDPSPSNYKVIFIAGNEDFLQGEITYTQACEKANKKGVIVNTIYCGDKMQGIREHWNLGGECGNGSFSNINHNYKIEDIATPYDSSLYLLNYQLNKTYVYYGASGAGNFQKQAAVDDQSFKAKGNAYKRVDVKTKKELYNNSGWDVVDAYEIDSTFILRVDMKTLPDSLQTKSRAELLQHVKSKTAERINLQKEIATLSTKRDVYIANERNRSASAASPTLESEIEKVIKEQVKRYKMTIQ